MFCSDRVWRLICLCIALAVRPVTAAEHIIGAGAELDTADSNALSVFGSIAVAGETWLSAIASRSHSDGNPVALDASYIDAGLDHHFKPLGIRLGAAYRGDPDLLESRDLRGSVYWRNDKASLSLDYERRAFNLTFESPITQRKRTTEFDADGVGISASFDLTDSVRIRASGMHYDYSRKLSLQPRVDRLRVFSLSRLGVVNSLLDEHFSGAIEYRSGSRVFDISVASWRTAVFADRVESIGIGLLTPLGSLSDIEFRVSADESDVAGRATLFSVFVYSYGE